MLEPAWAALQRGGARGHASAAATAPSAAAGAEQHTGLVELRQYTLKPEGIKEFTRLTAEKVELRKQLLPFLG